MPLELAIALKRMTNFIDSKADACNLKGTFELNLHMRNLQDVPKCNLFIKSASLPTNSNKIAFVPYSL